MGKGTIQKPKQHPEPEPGTIWRDDLAKLFRLQQATMLDKLAREGLAVRAAQPGYFRLLETIKVYVPHLREVAARYKSHDGKHDVAAESAQLKAAQRRLTELKIAKEQGDLISTSALLEIWGDLVKDVRAMMLSMPGRVQGELPHLVPSEVETLKRIAREMLGELKALGGEPPRPQ